MKYFLMILVAFALWLTAPMWMADRTGSTDTAITIMEENNTSVEKLSEKEQKQKEFIEKFGYKPRVDYDTDTPYVIKAYWRSVYPEAEKIEALRCTPMEKTNQGWMTICDFRVAQKDGSSTLLQEIYYIEHKHVRKK